MSKWIVELCLLFIQIKYFFQSVGESLLLPDDGGPFTGEFSPPLISFILSSDLIGGFIGSK